VQAAEGYPEPLKRVLILRWLMSAVAAATLEGKRFSSPGVLTLQGPQGIGKTSWISSASRNMSILSASARTAALTWPRSSCCGRSASTSWATASAKNFYGLLFRTASGTEYNFWSNSATEFELYSAKNGSYGAYSVGTLS
jgi:hypothetical protein